MIMLNVLAISTSHSLLDTENVNQQMSIMVETGQENVALSGLRVGIMQLGCPTNIYSEVNSLYSLIL